MSKSAERKEKFTPGPWDFTKGYKFYHCTSTRPGRSGFYFEVGKNAGSNLGSFDKQWMANAALIAAAPDMYAGHDRVAKRPAEIVEMLRREGFVFDNLEDRWQKLAFSLYTAIVELGSESESLMASARGES